MLSLSSRRAARRLAAGGGAGPLRHQAATFVDARIKWVRDRGLDHAVEKEKNLRPLLALKNLVLSEPGTSLPVSVAAERKSQLGLPTRAIEFIRKYPAVFDEFPDPADRRRPHVRLTAEAVELHEHERGLYESCLGESADRLLKLLMLTPARRLPLAVVDRLRWDMGLPNDYVRTILPDFPDYFELTTNANSQELWLDLVCWSKDLAVSAMERRAAVACPDGYKKGMPLAFPLQFSRGFDVEKKVTKWVDEWQKLPYISPYEDGSHLDPKSNLGEKWLVGVLHELLHLFIGKKAEKETILLVGEHLGLRPGLKNAFGHHPGIFYLSNKIRTHTIVLREAYKRDLLVLKHPLMGVRYQYIHLMHKVKEAGKYVTPAPSRMAEVVAKNEQEDANGDEEEEEGDEEDEEVEEEGGGEDEMYESTDDTSEDDVDERHTYNANVNRMRRGEMKPSSLKQGMEMKIFKRSPNGRRNDRHGGRIYT